MVTLGNVATKLITTNSQTCIKLTPINLISGHLTKSRKPFPLITVKLTFIKRSQLLFSRSQRVIYIVFTPIKRYFWLDLPY